MKCVLFFVCLCVPCLLKAQYESTDEFESQRGQTLIEYQYSEYVPFSLRWGAIEKINNFSSGGVYINLDFLNNDIFKSKWENDPECRDYYEDISICGVGLGAIYDPNHWVGYSAGATFLFETQYLFSDKDDEVEDAYHGIKLNGMVRLILGNLVFSAGGNFIAGENHEPKTEYCFGLGVKF